MAFKLEKISEDSFYTNITLNIQKHLEKIPGITNIVLHKFKPCSSYDICAWEADQGLCLPDDLKSFYSSTNGFKLTWDYTFRVGETIDIGIIAINPIHQLVLQLGCCNAVYSEVSIHEGKYQLHLGPDSRVYELALLEDTGKVCLVYLNNKYAPTIWLVDIDLQWYYLADNFRQYFRMGLAHLGLPMWQLCVVPNSLPPWLEQVFFLVAPHLLPTGRPQEELEEETPKSSSQSESLSPKRSVSNRLRLLAARPQAEDTAAKEPRPSPYPANVIDTTIFKHHKSKKPPQPPPPPPAKPAPASSTARKPVYHRRANYK